MKSIGFVGQTDSNGFILCVARLMVAFGKKVIYIDATREQRTRYTVPTIISSEKQEQYVTEFNGVQVAVGFNNILELKKYMYTKGEDFNDYDYVLIATNREEMCEEYDLKSANALFFMTTFDKFELQRGLEILKYLCAAKRREDTEARLSVSKVLTYTQVRTAGNNYINELIATAPVDWLGNDIELSYDQGDTSAFIQNQYSNKIEFKNISTQTQNGIIEATCRILEETRDRLKKTVKAVEKDCRF